MNKGSRGYELLAMVARMQSNRESLRSYLEERGSGLSELDQQMGQQAVASYDRILSGVKPGEPLLGLLEHPEDSGKGKR